MDPESAELRPRHPLENAPGGFGGSARPHGRVIQVEDLEALQLVLAVVE